MFNRRDDPTTTAGLPSASERLDLQLLVKQLSLICYPSRHHASPRRRESWHAPRPADVVETFAA